MFPICLTLALLLDLLIGDPHGMPHPIRWIGSVISRLEHHLYPFRPSRNKELLSGTLLCGLVILMSSGVAFVVLEIAQAISMKMHILLEVVIGFYCLSSRSLVKEALVVRRHLAAKNIEEARRALSMIVGRDTEFLNESEIARATVETVAENSIDGIISPLFFLMLGGAVAGLAFKAVSTMDSMIGYRNDRYKHFGTCAAKLDDILNFIPARLSAFMFIPAAGAIVGKNPVKIVRTVFRDRLKHPSPNSAHGEAAFAGALNINLGGSATYKGFLSKKHVINSRGRHALPDDILEAVRLTYALTILSFLLLVGSRMLICGALK